MIKNATEIEKMRVAGNLASKVLIMIEDYVKPGVTTEELDAICHNYIVNNLCNLYRGVPKKTLPRDVEYLSGAAIDSKTVYRLRNRWHPGVRV